MVISLGNRGTSTINGGSVMGRFPVHAAFSNRSGAPFRVGTGISNTFDDTEGRLPGV